MYSIGPYAKKKPSDETTSQKYEYEHSMNAISLPLVIRGQLAGSVEYTDCISLERLYPPPMSVLYVTLNHLMVSLQ